MCLVLLRGKHGSSGVSHVRNAFLRGNTLIRWNTIGMSSATPPAACRLPASSLRLRPSAFPLLLVCNHEAMGPTSYQYDVIVVGAGHAGTEAALAAARMGAQVALLTTNLDTVAQMSCNPAIGGVAKGQIVREIDALGGAMGQAIDATGIQFRMLNCRKGPAMHSPRAQADKRAYQQAVKHIVELQPNVALRQDTVEDLLTTERPATATVALPTTCAACACGAMPFICAPTVILTTGTFLQALMHTGEAQTAGGRAGEGTTQGISAALVRLGIRVERFKTGTPARLNGRTIDYAQTEIQPGDEPPQPFSFLTERLQVEQLPCWITHTNGGRARPDSCESPPCADVQRTDSDRADRGTARRSKTRSCVSPTATRTSCSWSRKAATRPKCTSTASPPACLAMCRTPCFG